MNLQMQLIVRAINNGTIYYALERDNGYEHRASENSDAHGT